MRGTQTFSVDFSRLQRAGPDAIVIIRLMMAGQDIARANWGLRYYRNEQPRLERHAQLGACMYFIRLQCGHLYEALKLVEEVKNSVSFCRLLERCHDDTRSSFERLLQCLPGGTKKEEFDKYIGKIRHNLAFHYNQNQTLVERALQDRASRREASRSTVTRGTDISLWHFGVADDIEDSIVCRQLWDIPRNVDLRTEADRIADFGSDLCRDFLDFCGELTFRFLREHATV